MTTPRRPRRKREFPVVVMVSSAELDMFRELAEELCEGNVAQMVRTVVRRSFVYQQCRDTRTAAVDDEAG